MHRITVTPIAHGQFPDQTAIIKYQRSKPATAEGEAQNDVELETAKVLSTARGMLLAVTREEYAAHFQPHRHEWLIFMAIAALIVGIPAQRYLASKRAFGTVTKTR